MSEYDSYGPTPEQQPELTDTYFLNTRRIVQAEGDCEVEYAVFMRRPVTYAGRLAVEWLQSMAEHRHVDIEIRQPHAEGAWVGAGEPLCFIKGPFSALVDMETIFLQRLGEAVLQPITPTTWC